MARTIPGCRTQRPSRSSKPCATGALLLDSLGRYRRSNQTVDMGATLAARQALSGGTCNDSPSKVIGDPNPAWMGSLLNEFTIMRKLRVRALLDGVFGNDVMVGPFAHLRGGCRDLRTPRPEPRKRRSVRRSASGPRSAVGP